jgi:hypothetical protein
MGRFFQIPAAFVIACGFTLVARMAWQRLPLPVLRYGAAALAIGFAAFMIVWPKVHLFYPLGVDDWGERNYRIAALQEIRARETAPFRVASVLPLQPAYAYAQGLETVDGWANLYPAFYRDLWYRALTPLFSELPYTRRIFGVDVGRPEDNFIFLGADLIEPGIGNLPGENVFEALKTGFDVNRRFNLNVLRLLNVKYLLSDYPLKGIGISLVHAPAVWPDFPISRSRNTGLVHGVRRPVVPDERFGRIARYVQPLLDIRSAWRRDLQGKDVFIYRLEGVLPRFRMVESVAIEPTDRAVLDRVAGMNSNEAVINATDAGALGGQRKFAPGKVSIVRYTPDEIVLDLDHQETGFLVIGNTWSPYWNAEIDGLPSALIRINNAQYGLVVSRAGHRVRLHYTPPYSLIRLLGGLRATAR